MNGTLAAPGPADVGAELPLTSFRRIVGVCDRFEAAWRAGQNPDVGDFLAAVPAVDRTALLDELLALDVELRGDPRWGSFPGSGSGSTQTGSGMDGSGGGAFDQSAPTFTLVDGPVVPREGPVRCPEIDDYEVQGELGRGGMGVVYKARHRKLKRLVALKMILAGDHAGAEHLARFAAEAEAVARLSHPNIVQIFEIGEQDGRPYFSLELVDGGSLARRLKGGTPPPRQAAQLVETLARAVAAAHKRGIVHRDLKPANVLMTAEGVPKITDFGLAKSLAESGAGSGDGDRTRSGAILGTPNYMAPEQADGRAIGPGADIYGLGAILYEMLTGRPPFRAPTALETLDLLRTREPEPPGRLRPRLPRDLETICLKCLEKEPARRYASAEDLADDLRAFLGGEPIRARPTGRWERAWRYARGRPAEASLAGAVGMATLGLAVGAWFTSGPLTAAATAVLGLTVGASHHGLRLKRALDEAALQRGWAERHNERLHLLLEMTRRLMAAPDLDALLLLLGETATRLANAERATIFLVDRDRNELWSKVAMGDGVGEIRLPLGVGIAGTVAATGRTINIPDAYADPRFSPETDRRTGYATRNLLAFPLADQSGRVLGVLQLLNKRTGPFLDDDEEILSALASSAALAVERARPIRPTPANH